jgi:hypothetical protein
LRLRDGKQINGIQIDELIKTIVTQIKERRLNQEPNKEVSH